MKRATGFLWLLVLPLAATALQPLANSWAGEERLQDPPLPIKDGVLNILGEKNEQSVHAQIKAGARVEHLKGVALDGSHVLPASLAELKEYKHLTELSLPFTNLNDEGLRKIGELTNLEYLSLASTKIDNEGFSHLTQLSRLQALILGATRVDDQSAEVFRHFKALKKLHFYGERVSDALIDALREAKGMSDLCLYRSGVSGTGVATLSKSFPALARLSLEKTQLSDSALRSVATMDALEFLNLSETGVTAVGIRELKNHKSLTCIVLSRSIIDDDMAGTLQEFKRLKSVVVYGAKMSDGARKLLADADQRGKLKVTGLNRIEALWEPASEPHTWPRTMDAAADRLLQELSAESKAQLKATKAQDLVNYHQNLGRTIRNSYGLWMGNGELMKDCRAQHPDDASSRIVEAAWQKLQ